MEVTHTKTGTKQACPDCKAQKLKCDPSHGQCDFHHLYRCQLICGSGVWSAGRVFQTSAGYLRVRVVEGDPISTTLMAGETPYLSAVAAIQLAQYKNRELDEESETLIADHSRGLAPSEYSRLNCLDPCLFPANERSEIQQERQAFYCKVWKLFNHFKHQISFKESRDQMQLMLTRPNYSTLEVLVCVRRFEVPGKEKRLLLGKGDTEDSCYTLSRRSIVDHSDSASTDHVTDHLRPRRNAPDRHQTSSQAFRNENNKRVRADEDILAGSCQPSSKNAKESHLTWASSSTSSLQPYEDAKSSIPSTTAEHIPTPHVSSLTLLNTPFEAESLSKKGKGTEQSEKDEEVKEDEEDKEKKRVEQISRNDDKSGRSNMSLVNDLLINGHDIPMGTSLGTLDQAVDMKQEYPTGSRQMYQPQPASTVVFPCTDPSWYTGAVAHQRGFPPLNPQRLYLHRQGTSNRPR